MTTKWSRGFERDFSHHTVSMRLMRRTSDQRKAKRQRNRSYHKYTHTVDGISLHRDEII